MQLEVLRRVGGLTEQISKLLMIKVFFEPAEPSMGAVGNPHGHLNPFVLPGDEGYELTLGRCRHRQTNC